MDILKNCGTIKYNYFSRYSNDTTYLHLVDKKYFNSTWKNLKYDKKSVVMYTTKSGDTLDTLSLKFFGTPIYWWIIADVNNIFDVVDLKIGIDLKIPQIASVEFQ